MSENGGRVQIAPEVIVTIARRTATNVPGVTRLVPPPAFGVSRMLRSGSDTGVSVTIDENEAVSVTLHLIADANTDVSALGRRLQEAIKRAIEEIVGLHVQAVNVQIEDVSLQ